MSRTAPRPPRDPNLEAKFRAAYERAKALSALLAGPSLAMELENLGRRDPVVFEQRLAELSPLDRARLAYAWEFHARPKQRPPVLPKHRVLAWIAARGLGKSRAAAERVRERIYAGSMAGMLAAPTIEDIERYQLGGKLSDAARRTGAAGVVESSLRVGLLDVFPPHQRPRYDRDKGEVHFHTGAVYYLQSSIVAEARGGNLDTAWVEEASKIGRANRTKLLDNIELALRMRGPLSPELIITCTPTRDPWIKELVADPGCVTILGDTEENAANLDPDTVARWRQRFGNSRLGRQEMGGEILGDEEGVPLAAMVSSGTRFRRDRMPKMKRIVVAIDPARSQKRNTDETGIVGAGRGIDDELYVFAAVEGRFAPPEWASRALDMYAAIGADEFVGETNSGGDLVESNLRLVAELRARKLDTVAAIRFLPVYARKSKGTRLEEVETLGEQGRVHLPEEGLPALEDQAMSWDPSLGGDSPNLLDALGWAAFALFDGWGEGADELAAKQASETRAAFAGFDEAQRAMPAPAWGSPPREREQDAEDAGAWDRA